MDKAPTKRKRSRYFELYIPKVLRRVSDGSSITSSSRQQLNSILCIVSTLISDKVETLTKIAKKKTISEKEVEAALKILLPEELAKSAVLSARRAATNYSAVVVLQGTSRQEKAGIVFPPSVAEKFLRRFGDSRLMVTNQAPIQLAAVIEYLASEILENAALLAKDKKRVRITVRDLEMGIRGDRALDRFFVENDLMFLGGGVVPYIHPQLLVKKSHRRAKGSTNGGRRYHRYRPGTVSVREIKRLQKVGDCLILPKAPFEKLVRSVVTEESAKGKERFKMSKDVFIVLQYFVEQQIVDLLQHANMMAVHAGRIKLTCSDISLVRSIVRGPLWCREKDDNPHTFGVNDVQLLCGADSSFPDETTLEKGWEDDEQIGVIAQD